MPIPLPKKPVCVSKEGSRAVIEIENLYPGYGMTLGNTLRRVLLSSLEGAAVTLVKIKGVSHEFSTIPGVAEDVVEILLNMKQLRFAVHSDEPQRVTISVHGEKPVTGKDIECPSQVEVVNPTLHIATVTDKKATFEAELTIEKGFGYVPVESRKKDKLEVGAIALDAIFTPIRKINYEVENMRVGERTDFDRVRFTIETDGTIDPEEAFTKAAQILVEQFQEIVSVSGSESSSSKEVSSEESEGGAEGSITDLNLSARVANSLSEAGIETVSSLVTKTEAQVLELEGMGDKGVTEIKKALKKMKLSLKEE